LQRRACRRGIQNARQVWTRPGIDPKTQRFMAMSMMIALRAWDEFRLHVRSDLTKGDLTKDELKEIIIQATAYCGAPAGNHAMQQAQLAFEEMADARPHAAHWRGGFWQSEIEQTNITRF
jgi:alkylhydroperoxidase/carboxymuconolactone decarboxylase family protein YurZ